jgi:hypothetical protein
MSQATIKKLQTLIFIYIIVIGRGGQSLYFAVYYFQLLAMHHAGLGLQCFLNLTWIFVDACYLPAE